MAEDPGSEMTEPTEVLYPDSSDEVPTSSDEVPAELVINQLGNELALSRIEVAKANALLMVRNAEITQLRALKSQRQGKR